MDEVHVKENREVKNSVFVDLFCYDKTAEENAIALYQALHDMELPKGTKIEWVQVDNIIYMTLRNDVAFEVDGKTMIFAEHQSTINENMPLRSLLYAGRGYEKLVQEEGRYRKKLIKIPRPEFYTFYNGREEYPKETILRLSDAYSNETDEETTLELVVRVININLHKQHEILEKCPVLKEYSQMMAKIREYQDRDEADAYKKAVKDCISQGILEEYLRRKGSEVCNMLIADYNYELDIKVQREEAWEDGLKEGHNQGLKEGRDWGLKEGHDQGLKEGRDRGLKEGQNKEHRIMILKIYNKGKTLKEIADMFDEPLEEVEKIVKESEM